MIDWRLLRICLFLLPLEAGPILGFRHAGACQRQYLHSEIIISTKFYHSTPWFILMMKCRW